jgi:CBS-domain-containing membrane protein
LCPFVKLVPNTILIAWADNMNPLTYGDQADMNPPGISDDATNLMKNKKIRRLVAVDRNKKMTGILTQRDILNKIVS